MKGLKLDHAMKPKLKSISTEVKFVTEGSLIDVREVHVLSSPGFVNMLICKLV